MTTSRRELILQAILTKLQGLATVTPRITSLVGRMVGRR